MDADQAAAAPHGSVVDRRLIETDIEAYLRRYQSKELLRFVAVGSVDDGKSTLIGRLLLDTGSVYEDQLAAVRRATQMEGIDVDLSLLTDGLAAEREQGITIDVAYRYFNTDKRKFIIADTPGHVQYTRNMVTGASTASVALILVDARLGVQQQSRRHAYIASLLGIPHLAVCVNKMDLVDFDRDRFEQIRAEFGAFTRNLSFSNVSFFPISALDGTNCVRRGARTGWYEGPTVLEFLEAVPVREERSHSRFRFPVQYVIRPHLDYRGFAGRIASGQVKKGDSLTVLPSGKSSRVKGIDGGSGEVGQAFAGESVTIRLDDEIDVSRGDMLVRPGDAPRVTRTFDAHLVWLHEVAMDVRRTYLLKHTTQTARVEVDRVHWRKDMDSLEDVPAPSLGLNDIGRVSLTAHRTLLLDGYAANRETGSFILIDTITNNTVAAGMVIDPASDGESAPREASGAARASVRSQVSAKERRARFGTRDAVVLVAGDDAPTAEALAYGIERRLFDVGASGVVLGAGDIGPTWAAVARAVADAGLLAVVAVDAEGDQQATSGARLARRAFLVRVTRASDAGRPDKNAHAMPPDLTVDVGAQSIERGAETVVLALKERGWID